MARRLFIILANEQLSQCMSLPLFLLLLYSSCIKYNSANHFRIYNIFSFIFWKFLIPHISPCNIFVIDSISGSFSLKKRNNNNRLYSFLEVQYPELSFLTLSLAINSNWLSLSTFLIPCVSLPSTFSYFNPERAVPRKMMNVSRLRSTFCNRIKLAILEITLIFECLIVVVVIACALSPRIPFPSINTTNLSDCWLLRRSKILRSVAKNGPISVDFRFDVGIHSHSSALP